MFRRVFARTVSNFAKRTPFARPQVRNFSSIGAPVLAMGGATAFASQYAFAHHDEDDVDYKAVRAAIAEVLDDENWDDGSWGPVLVRLAWHCAGTYDKTDGSGGSNYGSMRFAPESEHGANAGLEKARAFLEPIKAKFPNISYADLYTLAGVVAIEEMGGPVIGWNHGRVDANDASKCTPDGRLPDGTKGPGHLRDIFYRMGFNDQEIVALAGAHSMGRCHTDRSGHWGPWTRAPTTFSNLYFVELMTNKWTPKKWNGPPQYEDPTGELMMLEADLALIKDPAFKKWVAIYAEDEERFRKDFAAAFQKLEELGLDFKEKSALSKIVGTVGLAVTGLIWNSSSAQ